MTEQYSWRAGPCQPIVAAPLALADQLVAGRMRNLGALLARVKWGGLTPPNAGAKGPHPIWTPFLPMSDVRHETANKLPSSLHFERRTYGADEGSPLGFSQYVVELGAGLATAIELAERIAGNAPMTNFAAMHVLPRNAEQDRASGLLMEALMSAIAQSDPEAKRRLHDFLEKRAPKTLHR
jgi:hypothetical protein